MQEERRRNRHGARLSRFVFTLNNYTEEEERALKTITDVKWLIFGKEVGDNGTPHLQGACVIGKQIAFSTVKKWPGLSRAHIETMHGTPQQSLDYCTKQDANAYIFGEMPAAGKRNDLHDTIKLMKDGNTLRDIVNSDNIASIATIVRYPRGLQSISNLLTPPDRRPPVVAWLYGPTGVGKTRCAVEFAKLHSGEYWMSSGSLQWFNGYDGQKVAILDDYRSGQCPFEFFLRLLDRYPMRVQIKGEYVQWVPEVIIITAPQDPEQMHLVQRKEHCDQLTRRITLIHEVTEENWEDTLKKLSQYLPQSGEIHSDGEDITVPFLDEASCSDATMSSSDSDMSIESYNAWLERDRATVSLACDEDLSSVSEFH